MHRAGTEATCADEGAAGWLNYHRQLVGEFSLRHSRWRAWLRMHTPNLLFYRFGLIVHKASDCGHHEVYKQDDTVDACYH
jgi:hypothetical protein